jgi:hypothetical protein
MSFLFLVISSLFLMVFIGVSKKKSVKNMLFLFLSVGFGYFLLALLFLGWFFDVLSYYSQDLLVIYYGLILFKSLVLFFLFFSLVKRTSFLALFIVYFLSLIGLAFILDIFLMFSLSFLFLIFLFFVIRRVSINLSEFGLVYSLTSIILSLLFFIGFDNVLFFVFTTSMLFSLFVFMFEKDAVEIASKMRSFKNKKNYISTFFRYFIFMLVLVSLVMMGVLLSHEFGHIAVSKLQGCSSRAIFYDEGRPPYTEVICANGEGRQLATIAGFSFVSILAIILFISGGELMKEISLIAAGFNTVISYRDFLDFGINQNLSIFLIMIGILILVFGVYLLAKTRINDKLPFED